jgi:septum site-determining protein MinD
MNKIIGVLSAKGGVGKTTSAINLAAAFNVFGRSCLILDADITSPNVGIYLGSTNIPISLNLVLKGEADIFKAIYTHHSGINVILGSLQPNQSNIVDYKKVEYNLKKIVGHYDIILIDSAPGKFEDIIKELSSMDSVIIVTTPDMVAVTDALRTVTVARQHGKEIIGAILTRVGNHEHEIRKENIESMLGIKVLGSIPEDKNIPLSAKINSPIVDTHPYSDASVAYKKIAANIFGDNFKIINKK